MKKQPKQETKYNVRFLLANPVVGKGANKLLVVNTTVQVLDFTFLVAVSDKLRSNGLKLASVNQEDGEAQFLDSPKDLSKVILPELRCTKQTNPNNKSEYILTMANGKQLVKPKGDIHNLYINDEDYQKAKAKSKK